MRLLLLHECQRIDSGSRFEQQVPGALENLGFGIPGPLVVIDIENGMWNSTGHDSFDTCLMGSAIRVAELGNTSS